MTAKEKNANINPPEEKCIGLAVHEELKENIARVLSLSDNFVVLFDVDLETGKYNEYNKGQEYSADIKSKLVEYKEFFSDSLKNADRVVYADDREGFKLIMNREYIKAKLENNNHFDWYYRQVFDDKPVWFKMRFVYKNAEKKHLIIGIFNVAAEMAEREKNKRLQANLLNRMLGDEGLFLINLAEDTRKTIHNRCYMAEDYSDEEKHSETIKQYIDKYVAEVDREMMRNATLPANILKRLETETEFAVQYRDISSGVPRFYAMKIAKFSDTEILQSFSNIDREVVDQLLVRKLKEDFFALFCVDLATGKMQILKSCPWYNIGKIGEIIPYTSSAQAFASAFKGKIRENFERVSDIKYLKKRLAKENKITYSYKSPYFKNKEWVNLMGLVLERNEDGSPSMLLIGFGMMDTNASEKAELQQQLKEALMSAEVANRSKTTFLYNMSHDIRTPMNAILGFNKMAQKCMDNPDKLGDCLKKVDDAGMHLLRLINDILEMARIENGKLEIEEKVVNLKDCRGTSVAMLESLAKEKNIEFTKRYINADKDLYLWLDTVRVEQVLINIISNSIKYTPRGGKVEYTMERLCESKQGHAKLRFTVTDNGIGMSKEFAEKVFESFSRERNSTASGIQGTGLGMAIVKRLVDAMNGQITVKSKLGKGTTIVIEFEPKLADGGHTARTEKTELDETNIKGMKVLLVEDNELNREIACELLKDFGVTVDTAEDGTIAVDIMSKAVAGKYDAILMDIQMPVMDGYKATREIRKLPDKEVANVPIIAMTANAFAEDKKKAFASGMNEHVAKPIDIVRLKEVLSGYYSKKAAK